MKYFTIARLSQFTNWLVAALLLVPSSVWAQAPADYYDLVEGKSNKELKTALYTIIKEGTRLSYGSGSGGTWSGFEKSDLHPEGYVWDMYSLNKRYFPGNAAAPGGMNIEHSVAKSWWGGTKNDAYKDLYHLNPSDIDANSRRSNYPLGIVSNPSWENGSIKVGNNTFGAEYSGSAFEPLDEYKGDFARAYLYMFTCYENLSWTGTQAPTMIVKGETWPMLKPWAKDLLVQWTRQDPVSSKEINRAEEIYKLQKNRNPYIDYPELVEYLWGNMVGQAFSLNTTAPAITSPSYNSTITLPEVHWTSSSQIMMEVKGRNLEGGNINIAITGQAAAKFTVTPQSLTADEVNNGVQVQVTYNPIIAGSDAVTLTISGANLERDVVVTLSGSATDNFSALPATEIKSTSFVANWTPSSLALDYEVALYEKVVEVGNGLTVLADEDFSVFPQGWDSDGYTEVSGGVIRLGSGSNPGSITSPVFDLTSPSILTIKAKRYSSDSDARIFVEVDGDLVGEFLTGSSEETFELEIPQQTKESIIEIYALKNKRVYINELKIETGGDKVTYPMVEGYPRRTGIATNVLISDLNPETTYYYTVTTIAAESVTSSPMTVTTQTATSTPSDIISQIKVWAGNGQIFAESVPQGATINVYDLTGVIVKQRIDCAPFEQINLSRKGLYIVEIKSNEGRKVTKVTL
ncbi:MAG: endonuclease [Bacteroidales bacterium]